MHKSFNNLQLFSCFNIFMKMFFQVFRDDESRQLLQLWLEERQNLKLDVKNIFNPHFGSVFRANLAPSFFAGRLCRMADVYTSSVNNLVQYATDHFFFPSRGTLPHETIVYHPDRQHTKLENIMDKHRRSLED